LSIEHRWRESCQEVNSGLETLFITFLEMHRRDPRILFAAASSDEFITGVRMMVPSTIPGDGGESWNAINERLTMKAVGEPALSADGKLLYAATSEKWSSGWSCGKERLNTIFQLSTIRSLST